MSMTEKIKIMLVKRKMSTVDLAKVLECGYNIQKASFKGA